MVQNEAMWDRVLRVVLGLLITGWGIMAANWWGLIGLIPLLTGLAGYCPLYALLKISTCKK